MPLTITELNRLATHVKSDPTTVWLHTVLPTDANIANGRTTVGGGAYEAGKALAVAGWSNPVNGDISNNSDIAFGLADQNVGTVIGLSVVRGSAGVLRAGVTSVGINNGDTFTVPSGVLQVNGATT